jgi:hypothetical protein
MSEFLPAYALSVRQPWAWAIIHGGKDVENRTKVAITKGSMAAPGQVAIHASKGMTRDEYEGARSFMASIGVECPRPDALVRGAIIGSVRITAVAKQSSSPWFFGPWCLELETPAACEPIACPGQLGMFLWESRAGVGSIDPAKPWMTAWPDEAARPRRDAPLPATPQGLLL